jgi:hypothetical protein
MDGILRITWTPEKMNSKLFRLRIDWTNMESGNEENKKDDQQKTAKTEKEEKEANCKRRTHWTFLGWC